MDKDNNKPSEDSFLNELIRKSRHKSVEPFERPSDEDISAYLLGTATVEQDNSVKQALLQSSDFRKEVLQMTQDLENLLKEEPDSLKTASRNLSPRYSDFLKRYEKKIDEDKKEESFWNKLIHLRIPQLYAPIATAAAIVLFTIFRFGFFEPSRLQYVSLEIVSENLDNNYLVSQRPRDPMQGLASDVRPDPQAAAMLEIRNLIEYRDREFRLIKPLEKPVISDSTYELVLRLIRQDSTLIKEFNAKIPIVSKEYGNEVTAWALGLPTKNLYQIRMTVDTVISVWRDEYGIQGCVTFTFPDEGGYRAIVGNTFSNR